MTSVGRALALMLALAALSWSGAASASISSSKLRRATLLSGVELDATLRPSQAPPLRLTDGLRFSHSNLPALDHGGALDQGSRQVFAMTMGFLVGFGVGHLIARDLNGFALFLILDVALLTATMVLDVLFQGPFAVIGIAVLIASHVVQGVDAFHQAGGESLTEPSAASAARSEERSLLPTRKVIEWAF